MSIGRTRRARAAAALLDNTVLVGAVTIVVLALAIYLSYIAENGLPFVPTYQVSVQVANADEIAKNADVRVGGARVGQVLAITPEPASKAWPHPYAQLLLQLDSKLGPLPPDTRYRIRLSSVLGGKYLELIPGHIRTHRIVDGGTLTIQHELPFVDLDTALGAFGPATERPLRAAIGEYGDVLAGRGNQVNDQLYALGRLMPPLERLLGVVIQPSSRLGRLIDGGARTASALAAVAPALTDLLSGAATTFDALRRSQVGRAIDQTPATEGVATGVLRRSLPVLSEAAGIFAQLRSAAPLLRPAANNLDQVIRAGTPIWGPVPNLSAELRSALAAVQALARDPASHQVFAQMGSNDLATVGSSAFVGLGAVLRAVAPAQFACNVAGLWLRNFASALSEGDSTGAWLRAMPLLDPRQSTEQATPAPDLHINYYPIEDAAQCQAGNEGYTGKQLIGNPPRTAREVDDTSPPPGVLEEGRKAGLVP